MHLRHLWLTDFRSYAALEVALPAGLTAVVGPNGQGKTNLLEAVGWLATERSFRGAPPEALVRTGADAAVVRAEVEREGRELLVEARLAPGQRTRVLVNRSPVRRAADLLGTVTTTVFAPDDLGLVKGGPAERRGWLDELVVARRPRLEGVRAEVDRVLRQRNALLKQARADDPSVGPTLDVWDAKLVSAGEQLVAARRDLLVALAPGARAAVADLTGEAADVELGYQAAWAEEGLAASLAATRSTDLRRGVTTSPHRDDVVVVLEGRPTRTHASQGEQRSVALALRLAGHRLLAAEHGTPPVLLLDDVFSELDPARSAALVAHLPPGQALLTSASGLPPGARPELVLEVAAGTARPAPGGVGGGT